MNTTCPEGHPDCDPAKALSNQIEAVGEKLEGHIAAEDDTIRGLASEVEDLRKTVATLQDTMQEVHDFLVALKGGKRAIGWFVGGLLLVGAFLAWLFSAMGLKITSGG